jgi:hypothetical protein
MSQATNKKKKLDIRKRVIEQFDKEAFNARINRIQNEEGYPFFNEFLLHKILTYAESPTLLRFSEVCWKTRILVRDKMNHTWYYYYLKAKNLLPTQKIKHCHLLTENTVGLGGRNTRKFKAGRTTDVLLECIDEKLRIAKGLPGQYNHYGNNYNNHTWQQHYAMMRQPISQHSDKIQLSDIIEIKKGEWNDQEPNTNYSCRRRHLWKRIPYPRDHPVYRKRYDNNENYYWLLATSLADEVQFKTRYTNLDLQIKNITRNIAKLEKQRKYLKKVIELKKLASERSEIRYVPSKRPRFHMFRDEYERKNGKHLTPTDASKLWKELSEEEKSKYATLADLQHQDHIRKKEVSAIKF